MIRCDYSSVKQILNFLQLFVLKSNVNENSLIRFSLEIGSSKDEVTEMYIPFVRGHYCNKNAGQKFIFLKFIFLKFIFYYIKLFVI